MKKNDHHNKEYDKIYGQHTHTNTKILTDSAECHHHHHHVVSFHIYRHHHQMCHWSNRFSIHFDCLIFFSHFDFFLILLYLAFFMNLCCFFLFFSLYKGNSSSSNLLFCVYHCHTATHPHTHTQFSMMSSHLKQSCFMFFFYKINYCVFTRFTIIDL